MSFQPPVYISLTTIPSRVSRIVDKNVTHLLKQDYPHIVKIFVFCILGCKQLWILYRGHQKVELRKTMQSLCSMC